MDHVKCGTGDMYNVESDDGGSREGYIHTLLPWASASSSVRAARTAPPASGSFSANASFSAPAAAVACVTP